MGATAVEMQRAHKVPTVAAVSHEVRRARMADGQEELTSHSHRWLSYLTTVGTLNLLILAAVLSRVGITNMSACGILYVSSTSFRSFFPQSVTSRTTLRDCPPFSTAFHDRTVATIGELAFTVVVELVVAITIWYPSD